MWWLRCKGEKTMNKDFWEGWFYGWFTGLVGAVFGVIAVKLFT